MVKQAKKRQLGNNSCRCITTGEDDNFFADVETQDILASHVGLFVGRDERRAPLKTLAWEAKDIQTEVD